MASSSSSSLRSESGASLELPLIPCERCSKRLRLFTTTRIPESEGRKFYRCNDCDIFHWQARYAVMLIKKGHANDNITDFLMTALDDHSQGLESQSRCIKAMKQALQSTQQALQSTQQELHDLKAAMELMEGDMKKLKESELHDLKAAMDLMERDMKKLKGSVSATVKPWRLGMSLLLLFGFLTAWFLKRLNGEEAVWRLMLSP